jgi:hypothetical protein
MLFNARNVGLISVSNPLRYPKYYAESIPCRGKFLVTEPGNFKLSTDMDITL